MSNIYSTVEICARISWMVLEITLTLNPNSSLAPQKNKLVPLNGLNQWIRQIKVHPEWQIHFSKLRTKVAILIRIPKIQPLIWLNPNYQPIVLLTKLQANLMTITYMGSAWQVYLMVLWIVSMWWQKYTSLWKRQARMIGGEIVFLIKLVVACLILISVKIKKTR